MINSEDIIKIYINKTKEEREKKGDVSANEGESKNLSYARSSYF